MLKNNFNPNKIANSVIHTQNLGWKLWFRQTHFGQAEMQSSQGSPGFESELLIPQKRRMFAFQRRSGARRTETVWSGAAIWTEFTNASIPAALALPGW